MIRGIDHIELIVRDIEEVVDFFQKMGFNMAGVYNLSMPHGKRRHHAQGDVSDGGNT